MIEKTSQKPHGVLSGSGCTVRMLSSRDADTRKFIDIEDINSKRTHTLRFLSSQIAKYRLYSNVSDMLCKNKTGYAYVIVDERFGRMRYSVNIQSSFRTCYRSKHFPNALSAAEHALVKIKQIVVSFDRKYNNGEDAIHEDGTTEVAANPPCVLRRRSQRAAALAANAKYSNDSETYDDDDDETPDEALLPAKNVSVSQAQQVALHVPNLREAEHAAHALVTLQDMQLSLPLPSPPTSQPLPPHPTLSSPPPTFQPLPPQPTLSSPPPTSQSLSPPMTTPATLQQRETHFPVRCCDTDGGAIENLQGVGPNRCAYLCHRCNRRWSQLVLMTGGCIDPQIRVSMKQSRKERKKAPIRSYKCGACRKQKVWNKELAAMGVTFCDCRQRIAAMMTAPSSMHRDDTLGASGLIENANKALSNAKAVIARLPPLTSTTVAGPPTKPISQRAQCGGKPLSFTLRIMHESSAEESDDDDTTPTVVVGQALPVVAHSLGDLPLHPLPAALALPTVEPPSLGAKRARNEI